MSTILVEGNGSTQGSVPVLQKVEKVVLNAPELVKVVAPGLTQVNASKVPQNDSKGDSVPPLTPVPKADVPPLTKVEPAGPPPLVKVEKTPVVEVAAPPLTLVKTVVPENAPPLQVAVKKEFTGLIFEDDGEDNINLRRVFIGKDADSLNHSEKLNDLLKSICREEVIKEANRKKAARIDGSNIASTLRFDVHRSTAGIFNKHKTVAAVNIQVLVSETVRVIDPHTRVVVNNSRVDSTEVFSSKTFLLMVVENSTDININMYPALRNNRENNPLTRSNLSEEFLRSMLALENEIVNG
jgi:hypothetical protein